MFQKSKERRGVNREGFKKSKLSRRLVQKNVFQWIEKQIPKKYKTYLYKVSEHIFKLALTICCKLSFIPLSIDCEGKVKVGKSRGKLAAHYSIMVLQMIRMAHIIVVVAMRAVAGVMDLTTYYCIWSLLSFLVAFLFPSALFVQPHDTAQLLNTSPLILSLFPKDGKSATVFQNTKHAILIIFIAFLSINAVFANSAHGFLLDEFPISLYHIVESVVGRPSFVPCVFWKLLFWPMELLTFAHILILVAFTSMMVIGLPKIVQACTREMRKLQVNTVESWIELRQKYYQLQVYVCLCNSWVKYMSVLSIFGLSTFIVILLYIMFRHTAMPIVIYMSISIAAVSILMLLFWFFLEVITAIQSTEAIVATLNSKGETYFLELTEMQRRYLTKYGKATRPVVIDIGDFVDYSLDVPIRVWDEILNQLLFLLTF